MITHIKGYSLRAKMLLFHLMTNEKGEYGFSPVPVVDMLLGDWTRYVQPGFPLQYLQMTVTAEYPFFLWGSKHKNRTAERVLKNLMKLTARENIATKEIPAWKDIRDLVPEGDNISIGKSNQLFETFLKLVKGRQLTESEIRLLGKKLDVKEEELLFLLQSAVCMKIAEWVPVFDEENSPIHCRRCGSSVYVEWPSVYGKTYTCKECQAIGPVNSLQVLYRLIQTDMDSDPAGASEDSTPAIQEYQVASLTYSAAQRQAAKELCDHVLRDKTKETLLWAACGAGKTEVCFPLIQQFLRENKRVLFAAPRQDVVHDVQPRLQGCFPDIEVAILSGSVPLDFQSSQLTVATTHQVLRFYHAFDVIIFDEIDAYPYAGSQMLAYGMRHALKVNGQMIYLTATPSEEILERVSENKCPVVKLPVRYHGNPLPVPEWHKIDISETHYTKDRSKLVSLKYMDRSLIELKEILSELTRYGPLLIFVPTVALVKVWKVVLAYIFSDLSVEGSWSSDPERRNKVTSFCMGKGDIFVCTSILERGVTIKGVQTVILYADHELFNTRTLVQMSGRTGRTAECYSGRVLFLASKETSSMVEAKQWIVEQNNLAKAWGSSHG